MDFVQQRREMVSVIKEYILENKDTIEKQYKFKIDDRICNEVRESVWVAWLQVHTAMVLRAKGVRKCREFKEIMKDFMKLNIDTEASLYF